MMATTDRFLSSPPLSSPASALVRAFEIMSFESWLLLAWSLDGTLVWRALGWTYLTVWRLRHSLGFYLGSFQQEQQLSSWLNPEKWLIFSPYGTQTQYQFIANYCVKITFWKQAILPACVPIVNHLFCCCPNWLNYQTGTAVWKSSVLELHEKMGVNKTF